MHIVRFVARGDGTPSVGVSDGVTVHDAAHVRPLPPVDARMEVWAAGVTHRRERRAAPLHQAEGHHVVVRDHRGTAVIRPLATGLGS
ncbi:hypothetical protein [Spongiactinospora sp. TRM90649]|uniref:hypothetical protein n=1 Tax=Spongiactinospora sp. TRM90649 TaxID=3031114 RepID=UPI0023F8D887|nr:hypothetical protein [Spongiactinospora sp. TRM90649]MDF5752271.1 hypothetical protein [Spongiactinospora sp. TRM90649]